MPFTRVSTVQMRVIAQDRVAWLSMFSWNNPTIASSNTEGIQIFHGPNLYQFLNLLELHIRHSVRDRIFEHFIGDLLVFDDGFMGHHTLFVPKFVSVRHQLIDLLFGHGVKEETSDVFFSVVIWLAPLEQLVDNEHVWNCPFLPLHPQHVELDGVKMKGGCVGVYPIRKWLEVLVCCIVLFPHLH